MLLVDAARIASLRSRGLSWAKIGEQFGLGEGTIRRTAAASAKNPLKSALATPMESAACVIRPAGSKSFARATSWVVLIATGSPRTPPVDFIQRQRVSVSKISVFRLFCRTRFNDTLQQIQALKSRCFFCIQDLVSPSEQRLSGITVLVVGASC